jgi:hypothetical protein
MCQIIVVSAAKNMETAAKRIKSRERMNSRSALYYLASVAASVKEMQEQQEKATTRL